MYFSTAKTIVAINADDFNTGYVFERMNLHDKSLVLIVGDSLKADIQGGLNYGIDTCYFNPKRNENNSGITPKYEIEKLSELLDFER